MKDLKTIELDTANTDVAFTKIATELYDKRFDIAVIRLVDTFMRYNIKSDDNTYYYVFEILF